MKVQCETIGALVQSLSHFPLSPVSRRIVVFKSNLLVQFFLSLDHFFFVSFFKFLKRKSKTCCIFSISAILSSSRIGVHKRMMEWIANVKWKTPSIAATSLNKCKIGICRSIEKCFVFQFPDYIHICLYLQRIYQHGSISSSIFFLFMPIFFLRCFFYCCLLLVQMRLPKNEYDTIKKKIHTATTTAKI